MRFGWRGRAFTEDLSSVPPEVFRLVVERRVRSFGVGAGTGLRGQLRLRWNGADSLVATYRTPAVEGWYRQTWWTPWWEVRARVDRDGTVGGPALAVLLVATAWLSHRRNGRGRRTRGEYEQALDELGAALRRHFGSDVPRQVLVPDEDLPTTVLAFRDEAEFRARMGRGRAGEPSGGSFRLRETAAVLEGLPDEATFVCYLGPGAGWTVPCVGYDAYRDR